MICECETVEQRDQDGNLEAIGVRWTEARVLVEGTIDRVGQFLCVIAFLAIPAVLFGYAARQVPLGVALGFVAFAAAVIGGLIVTSAHMPGVPRELSFWHDGTCYAPDGLRCLAWRQDRLPWLVSDIENIEVEQTVKPVPGKETVYDHGVRIIFRRGRIAHVAHRLEADDAHKLNALLIEALAELRAGAGSERVASRMAGRAPRQERLID